MHKLYTSNREVKLEKRDHSLSRVSQKYSHFHHLVAQGLPVHVLPSLAHAGVRRVRLLAVLEAWSQAVTISVSGGMGGGGGFVALKGESVLLDSAQEKEMKRERTCGCTCV